MPIIVAAICAMSLSLASVPLAFADSVCGPELPGQLRILSAVSVDAAGNVDLLNVPQLIYTDGQFTDASAARGLESRLIKATGQLEAAEPRPGLAARITAQALAAPPAKTIVDRWGDWIRGAWPVAALGTATAIALLVFYPAPEPANVATELDEDAALAGLVDEDVDDGATLLALEDAVLPLED